MAFDNQIRNKLSRLVTECRRLLTDEFSRQMQETYGIQPDGHAVAIDRLAHLSDEEAMTAELLRERLHHLASALEEEKKPLQTALDRMLREQAFTVLNRFAALRMCEERGLVQACARKGVQSQGFQVYLRTTGSSLGTTFERYRTYLYCLFDEISVDLGQLFDRFSLMGLLFPNEATLYELLEKLDDAELAHIWLEDETIGWIYQYFNPKEERQEMRKASAAPRNSRELAVRNQFFTPRYVVEFLTDNTLGRIWYEMQQGNTRLTDQCRYLVRRPLEIFLRAEETAPAPPENQEEMSQEELLRQPHYIPFRPKKDPREILMLDPAGGSGHFGLYCFDLYQVIYEEAWDDPDLSPKLQQDYKTRKDFLRDIPQLILRHNIHIIDIDPRAVQIASLALWLRAQRSWQESKILPQDRPRITKSNVVCAEPMPGDKKLLKEFTSQLQPPLLAQIVEKVFDRMQLAGEAGSLLKIEEEMQEAITTAKEQWQRDFNKARDKKGNTLLFSETEMDKLANEKQLKLELFDVSQISDAAFWHTVEERITSTLRNYAEHAGQGQSISRRLFADDAAQGFAFIDIFQKQFDVILMNPPFGEPSEKTFLFLSDNFVNFNNNMLCAFIERSISLLFFQGKIGVIYDRTSLVKSTYKSFRENILLKKLHLSQLFDLGWEVLDAQVEVTTSILDQQNTYTTSLFINVRQVPPIEKNESLSISITNIYLSKLTGSAYIKNTTKFINLPNAVIGYDFPAYLIRAFNCFSSLEKQGYKCYQGHALKADKHFRLWFEIPRNTKAIIKQLYNGSHFTEYVAPLRDVLVLPRSINDLPIDSSTVLRNLSFHNLPGVCYGVRGDYLDAHILPSNRIFTVEGQSMPIKNEFEAFCILGFLNTTLFRFGLNLYSGQHKYSGYINLFPFTFPKNKLKISETVQSIVRSKLHFSCFDETQQYYVYPLFFFSQTLRSSIKDASDRIFEKLDNLLIDEQNSRKFIEESYCNAFDVTSEDRAFLETYSQTIPKAAFLFEDIPPSRETLPNFVTIDLISYIIGVILGRWDIRLLSLAEKHIGLQPFHATPMYPLSVLVNSLDREGARELLAREKSRSTYTDDKTVYSENNYPVNISWLGIIVDDSFAIESYSHQYDILLRVREVLAFVWTDQAAAIEQEACEKLGVKSLRDYFRKPSAFFQDHLKRYSKSRRQAPIYWPLSSENGNYTLWIYYHRLTDQLLYTCINDFVEPRIEEVGKDIERIKKEYDKSRNSKLAAKQEELQDFMQELKNFRDALLAVAKLPYKPDLNDGVLICAAPLWKLFKLPKWQKDLKACWQKLQDGEYDWAHLAYAIWPDRVRAKCVTDKSLAIAHDLEILYEEKRAPKKKRSKLLAEEEEEELIDS